MNKLKELSAYSQLGKKHYVDKSHQTFLGSSLKVPSATLSKFRKVHPEADSTPPQPK